MKYLSVLIILTIAIILSQPGCLFQDKYQPTSHYDLDTTTAGIKGNSFRIEFAEFTTSEPVRFKMVYRDHQNLLLVDNYNKWIQPPGPMLSRYLRVAFRNHNPTTTEEIPSYKIGGDIFMFQIDIEHKRVTLGINYSISRASSSDNSVLQQRTASFTEPFTENAPAVFAAAMSRCVASFATLLEKKLRSMSLASEQSTSSSN